MSPELFFLLQSRIIPGKFHATYKNTKSDFLNLASGLENEYQTDLLKLELK